MPSFLRSIIKKSATTPTNERESQIETAWEGIGRGLYVNTEEYSTKQFYLERQKESREYIAHLRKLNQSNIIPNDVPQTPKKFHQ